MNDSQNITSLKSGEKMTIVDFSDVYIARKLMAMGLLPGVVVTLVRRAPFDGAYYIKVQNQYIALRKKEAEHVMVSNGG